MSKKLIIFIISVIFILLIIFVLIFIYNTKDKDFIEVENNVVDGVIIKESFNSRDHYICYVATADNFMYQLNINNNKKNKLMEYKEIPESVLSCKGDVDIADIEQIETKDITPKTVLGAENYILPNSYDMTIADANKYLAYLKNVGFKVTNYYATSEYVDTYLKQGNITYRLFVTDNYTQVFEDIEKEYISPEEFTILSK